VIEEKRRPAADQTATGGAKIALQAQGAIKEEISHAISR
jgi:hypothetical protein